MDIWNSLVGVVGIAGGIYIVKEAFYINENLIRLGWVEQKFGPGTGVFAYRILGLGIIIFSFFVTLGKINVLSTQPFQTKPTGSSSQTTSTQNPTLQINRIEQVAP